MYLLKRRHFILCWAISTLHFPSHMDSSVTHFLQLLAWLTLALVLFGIGRFAIYCLEKEVALAKWFPYGRSITDRNSIYDELGHGASAFSYEERWHKEDMDDLGRANSFLGSLFFILSLFYVDDLGERFDWNSLSTYGIVGIMVGATIVFNLGWSWRHFRGWWHKKAWVRTLCQSIYLATLLFAYIYLAIGAKGDWPLYLIGAGVYLALFLLAYVCFVRRHERRVGWDFWSMSYMLCLVNFQYDWGANVLYAIFYAHFMATVARYQPPRLFYSMYTSSVPANC